MCIVSLGAVLVFGILGGFGRVLFGCYLGVIWLVGVVWLGDIWGCDLLWSLIVVFVLYFI